MGAGTVPSTAERVGGGSRDAGGTAAEIHRDRGCWPRLKFTSRRRTLGDTGYGVGNGNAAGPAEAVLPGIREGEGDP